MLTFLTRYAMLFSLRFEVYPATLFVWKDVREI